MICRVDEVLSVVRVARDEAQHARHNATGAQEVAQRVLDRVAELEAAVLRIEEQGGRAPALAEALRVVSKDMHHASSRPCSTCNFATSALGEPFGCVAFAAARKAGS